MIINGLNISEEFYLSEDDTEDILLELVPGARENFRLLVSLSETTSDDYQNEFFTANLHLAAKQIMSRAQWPVAY